MGLRGPKPGLHRKSGIHPKKRDPRFIFVKPAPDQLVWYPKEHRCLVPEGEYVFPIRYWYRCEENGLCSIDTEEPNKRWSGSALKDYAKRNNIRLRGAKSKAAILERIENENPSVPRSTATG